MAELIVGLDIGTTKICAVVGEPSEQGGIDIVGIGTFPSTGLRRGVVVNIDQTVQSIRKAVDEAENMAGCEIRSVYAGIAGSHIKGSNSHGVIAVKAREVNQRDIERVLDAAKAVAIPTDREVIHILPQEYVIDSQRGIANPLGMAGVRLEVNVHIVTVAVPSVQNILRSCQRARLDVTDIVLEALASSKSILTEEERELGVAIVDLGGGTSDIAVFAGNAIKHTGAVSLGGQNLTNDIAYGLRTPMSAAEQIKVRHGCALAELVRPDEIIEVASVGGRPSRHLPRQLLTEICEARMEEILTLVDQDLERSGFKRQIGAGVVLTGGTALIQGCPELAEQIFNMPTRLGCPRNLGGLKDMVNNPQYATAVGLLFYGAEMEGGGSRFRSGGNETSTFNSILTRMKQWFEAIK